MYISHIKVLFHPLDTAIYLFIKGKLPKVTFLTLHKQVWL